MCIEQPPLPLGQAEFITRIRRGVCASVAYLGSLVALYCKSNLCTVFPNMELRGVNPNSYIHVSVRDLYIPRIGSHMYLATAI
jgi:hypothetical protein